jgi:Ca2+-transporting ATPase
VIERCTRIMTAEGDTEELGEKDRESWIGRNEDLAGSGLRALALAQKTVNDESGEPYEDLTLIGLVGLLDPAREEVREAVLQCREAGIKVVMVTGDQPQTARAIAEAVGLVDDAGDATVVLGSDMKDVEEMSDEDKRELMKTPIFARFDPAQKLDLIELYKDAGLVVAMTGDGVNDAPALKKADIGVAMGQRGTEVAREAADMVLRDDSFASIVTAVRQGRAIFGNIRKFVLYMLSGNAGEIFAVALAALLGVPLPLLPLQILYINIVSDVFPALALGVGETREDVMKRPPRDPGEHILTRDYWVAIAAYGVLIGGAILAVFWYAFQLNLSQSEAVTVSFLAFGFARLWHVLNMRDPGTTILDNAIVSNPYVWGAVVLGIALMLAAAYVPLFNTVLETTPPSGQMWLLILAGSLVPLLVGQFFKLDAVRRLVPARLGGEAGR